jgi:hypothetical protein
MAWHHSKGSSLKILKVAKFAISDKEVLPPIKTLGEWSSHTGKIGIAETIITKKGELR